MKTFVIYLLLCTFAVSCKKLVQFHPNEVRPLVENLTEKNIELIKNLPVKSTFTFIVVSDLQRFYEELEDFVEYVNAQDSISFVLIGGDLSDFGLSREFNIVAEELQQLKLPYLATIGNHDMLANGSMIFRKMFGPDDYTFSYGSSKFIIFNSNSREVGFDGSLPDMDWLRREASEYSNYTNTFFFSHVPPFSSDFDKQLEPAYTSLLSGIPNARLSIHGHEHNYNLATPYNDGVLYLVAPTVSDRSYAQVTVTGGQISVEQKYF